MGRRSAEGVLPNCSCGQARPDRLGETYFFLCVGNATQTEALTTLTLSRRTRTDALLNSLAV